MDVVKYNFALSDQQPFVYDCQQYGLCYEHPGSDMHEALHLLIMLNGSFDVEIGGSRDLFSAGDIILIAPWEVHGNYIMRNQVKLFSITVAPTLLRSGLSAAAARLDALLLLSPQERMQLLNRSGVAEACKMFVEKNIPSEMWLPQAPVSASEKRIELSDPLTQSAHFVQILQLFINILTQSGPLEPEGGKSRLLLRIQPALHLLSSGSERPLTVNRAAQECHLSSSYFNVIFQQLYGMSFYAYELKYRLRRAESDLRHTAATVKELSERWGFADAAHFSRTFKKHYGTAPSFYRT